MAIKMESKNLKSPWELFEVNDVLLNIKSNKLSISNFILALVLNCRNRTFFLLECCEWWNRGQSSAIGFSVTLARPSAHLINDQHRNILLSICHTPLTFYYLPQPGNGWSWLFKESQYVSIRLRDDWIIAVQTYASPHQILLRGKNSSQARKWWGDKGNFKARLSQSPGEPRINKSGKMWRGCGNRIWNSALLALEVWLSKLSVSSAD